MIEDLYKKKVIRDYLSLFSENKWKKLIPLTLEHGILNLQNKTNITSLSLDHIYQMNETIRNEIENKNKPEKEHAQHEGRTMTETSNVVRSKSKEIRPSSKWRKGDAEVFKKKEKKDKKNVEETSSLNSDIYPKWWGSKAPKYDVISYNSENSNMTQEIGNTVQTEIKQAYEETKNEKNDKNNRKKERKENIKKKENKKSTYDIYVKRAEKPLRTELKEIESKIKNDVERDRKMYNLQKQNMKTNTVNKEPEYTFPRKKKENTESSYLKTIMTSDYKIEYDKSLKPQAIREKSIERKVPANKIQRQSSFNEDRVDFNRKEPITQVSNNNINYNSENDNYMSETEGGLSSYAPSERTKSIDILNEDFFSQFKENSVDKSSVLSNSLNYSSDKINSNENNKSEANIVKKQSKHFKDKTVSFNNYMNKNK